MPLASSSSLGPQHRQLSRNNKAVLVPRELPNMSSETSLVVAVRNSNPLGGVLQLMSAIRPSILRPLPREVLRLIYDNLSLADLKSLRLTCKAMTELVDVNQDIKRAHSKLKAALLAEEIADYELRVRKYANYSRWARPNPNEYRTHYSSDTISNLHKNYITRAERLNCYSCLISLPRACFGDNQITGSRSLGHKNARLRFCMGCGVKRCTYQPGVVIKLIMKSYVFCKGCRSIQKGTPTYRAMGVCSATCLETSSMATQSVGQKHTQYPGVTSGSGTSVHENRQLVKSTRATRCLRCWGVDHTERLADGAAGTQLCRACEVSRP